MKTFKILLCGLFTIVVCQTRLDYNSEDCNHYLQKIIKQQKGIAPTSLSFTGDSALNSDQSSVIISLRYTDSLYNDEIYFGLTQEDGKTPEQTCLDLKLWKFTSTSYTDPVEVTDLPFTASTNLQKYWRYLSFTIKENELTTRLVQSSNSNFIIYTGYYSISYYAAGTTQLQYTFYFQFSVTVSKSKEKLISTTFRPFNLYELKGCASGGCAVQPSSQLKWCKDVTCTDNSIPELHLYDQFYILQIVTASSLASYYLTDTVVELIGNGLNQQIIPVLTDNSKPGQVLILLTAEIVWVDFSIQVISYLSTTQTGSRLLVQEDTSENDSIRGRILTLDQIIFDPISGITAQIPCIFMNYADAICPTCTDQCKVNQFALKECSECNDRRLAFDSQSCNNYLKKFGTVDQVMGIGPTALSFTGDTTFTSDKLRAIITLGYTDPLFNDQTYFGLTQEDGKTPDQTCLDLKLWKFSSNSYSDPIQVTDLSISAQSNQQKQKRYLSFSIKSSDFVTRLIQSSNSNQYVYTGYYAIAYYVAGITQLQYIFYFQFSITQSRSSQTIISTSFTPYNQYETAGCTPSNSCTIQPSSQLKWCTDSTCLVNSVPNLQLNDQFYIQQVVTAPNFNNYYLINTVVSFIGDGLNQQIIPISFDNQKTGQVIMLLPAQILWANFSIQVTSYLSTTQTGNRLLEKEEIQNLQLKSRRLFQSNYIYDPVTGISELITCIKQNSGDAQCPTCAQQCQANGVAKAHCSECHGRLDFKSDICNNYLKKFGNTNSLDGPTSLSYTGEANFETGQSDLIVSLRYFDALFNDAKYWGLVQEDGKMPEETCLDFRIWKFTSIAFNQSEQITDLHITTASNLVKKWRYLNFILNGNDFSTKLVKTSNTNYNFYSGYYAIAYYAAGTEQIQYTFYFQFSATVYKSNGTIISTSFQPFSQLETIGCSLKGPCNVAYSSAVKWCTDMTCLINTIPNLYYLDQFYIQQVVTPSEFSNYYLVYTVVTLIGDGLNIEIQPISLDNSKPGQVTILLQINYVWSNLRILVTSYLSTSQYGFRLLKEDELTNRRLLTSDQIKDPVSGLTETITCIKINSDDTTCPTCNDECRINRFSRSECKECHDRLDSESFACNKYKKKFDNIDSDIIPTTLSFTGDTIVATGNQDIIVSLRYFDSLSTDATYFGLTQEDGKTPETTCLDLKLWKYSDNFTDPVEITDLPIKGSLDKSKKYRFLNFTINGTDFTTRLIQSANSDYYIYNGYYAIGYYLALSDINIYTFYFQFSITVSKLNRTIVSTFFKPFNQLETQNCSISEPCNVSPSSELKLCTDASCSINKVPNLYLFDQFYLQQIVTIESLNNYYLINTTVYYVGNGLIKSTKPIKINNNQPGKVLLLLNADVAWNNISIQVISYISTTSKGTRLLTEDGRLLATKTIIYDSILGITQPITCIKMISYDTCASCVDECKINGFAKEGCVCCNNNTNIPDYQIPNIDSLLNIIIIIYLII